MKNVVEYMSAKETAVLLSISPASISNWVKQGYLSHSKWGYPKQEVQILKKKLDAGTVTRLNTRANKSRSHNIFIPNEYITSEHSLQAITSLVKFIQHHHLETETSLFLLMLNLLKQYAQWGACDGDFLNGKNYKRQSVFTFTHNWYKKLTAPIDIQQPQHQYLLNYDLPKEQDILGIMYQSLLWEGKKSQLGSYYTPEKIIAHLLSNKLHTSHQALDPCCGTGQFLLHFAQKIKDPNHIYGCDIDPIAVNIAKFNLLIAFIEDEFTPNIFHLNTLLVDAPPFPKMDLIATNPPWGAKYSTEILSCIKKKCPDIKSKETFSFFIVKMNQWLKKQGEICMILPESITNIRAHEDIRRYILDKYSINSIQILGRCFKKVMSSVIGLSMTKKNSLNHSIDIEKDQIKYQITQNRFLFNNRAIFDIHITPQDLIICKKLEEKPHVTLQNNACWALGIVTGNNKLYLHSQKTHKEMEVIYKGTDINPFYMQEAYQFIHYTPQNFQQVAPLKNYRASEKLLYRFISKRLIFAYANHQHLTLNSANILIPHIPNYPTKIVLGFLNSDLFNFYFMKKFNALKILRGDIEQLPFPLLRQKQQKIMIDLVDDILHTKKPEKIKVLNQFIFELFFISKKDQAYIYGVLQQ